MQYDIEAVYFIYAEGRTDRHIFPQDGDRQTDRHTILYMFISVQGARTTQKLRTTCDMIY
jgi:hypothetical protein